MFFGGFFIVYMIYCMCNYVMFVFVLSEFDVMWGGINIVVLIVSLGMMVFVV